MLISSPHHTSRALPTAVAKISNKNVYNYELQLPGACQTKIEVRGGVGGVTFRSAVRVCTTRQACMNNAAGNSPKCFPGENGVRVLFRNTVLLSLIAGPVGKGCLRPP